MGEIWGTGNMGAVNVHWLSTGELSRRWALDGRFSQDKGSDGFVQSLGDKKPPISGG